MLRRRRVKDDVAAFCLVLRRRRWGKDNVAAVYLGVLASRKAMHFVGLLAAQIGFGYANVVYAVPDSLAFIHHALGVLMLLYAWSIAYATAVEYEEVSYGSVKHA